MSWKISHRPRRIINIYIVYEKLIFHSSNVIRWIMLNFRNKLFHYKFNFVRIAVSYDQSLNSLENCSIKEYRVVTIKYKVVVVNLLANWQHYFIESKECWKYVDVFLALITSLILLKENLYSPTKQTVKRAIVKSNVKINIKTISILQCEYMGIHCSIHISHISIWTINRIAVQ